MITKRLLLFSFLFCFSCILLTGMEKNSLQQIVTSKTKSIVIKTYDDKKIEVPLWHITQMPRLYRCFLEQKNKTSNLLGVTLDISKTVLHKTVYDKKTQNNIVIESPITKDMFLMLMNAQQSSNDFKKFYTNLAPEAVSNLINVVKVFKAKRVLRLIIEYYFPLEIKKKLLSEDKIDTMYQERISSVVAFLTEIKVISGHNDTVFCGAYNAKNTQIVSGSKTIILWDIKSSKNLMNFAQQEHSVVSIAFSGNCEQIVSGLSNGTIIFQDIKSNKKVLYPLENNNTISRVGGNLCIAFNHDFTQIASGSYAKDFMLWDVKQQKNTLFQGHDNGVLCFAFNHNKNHIISGSYDKTIIMWDIESISIRKIFKGHTESVHSIAFSPNDKYIVSGSNDNTVILWDVESGEIIKKITGHTKPVRSVAFSHDNKYIVSGSDDNVIILWDLQGTIIQTFKGHTAPISFVAFNKHSTHIISGSDDKTLVMWPTIDNKIINYIKTKCTPEQQEFLYRLYIAKIINIPIELVQDDPDTGLYNFMKNSLKNCIHNYLL